MANMSKGQNMLLMASHFGMVEKVIHVNRIKMTRWWFHIFFFNVHPYLGEMIQFD